MAALWDQLPWPCSTLSRGCDMELPAHGPPRGIQAGLGRLFSIFSSLLSTVLTVLLAGQQQQRFAGQSRGTKGALPEHPNSLSPISRVEDLFSLRKSGRNNFQPLRSGAARGANHEGAWCFWPLFPEGHPG